MATATIKSKTGATITIEGTEGEVSKIIAKFERDAEVQHVKTRMARREVQKREGKKRMTASDIIVGLKEHGYFNKPKTLTEIAGALEEKGYIYPTTTLSGVMLALVKKKFFGRKKSEGQWVYGK